MTTRRQFLATSLGGIAGSMLLSRMPVIGAETDTPAGGAAGAARRLLDQLTAEQRSATTFSLNDAERFQWHFVPLNDRPNRSSTRKGVKLQDMSNEARAAAMDLLKTATSADGYRWCEQIMDRETMLAELEPQNVWYRRPDWYFFTVYGEPGETGNWGWRIDGHHLTISAAVQDNQVTSATPYFMGLNPVTVKHGPRTGERETITGCEDLARDLFLGLDPAQRTTALQANHLREVPGRTLEAPNDLPARLSASRMNNRQQEQLLAVVDHYLNRMPAGVAEAERKKLEQAGVEKISFTYTGEADAATGKRHTYAVQGPTFQVHYLNEQTDPQQNPANHIHSIYRSLGNDFGGVKPA